MQRYDVENGEYVKILYRDNGKEYNELKLAEGTISDVGKEIFQVEGMLYSWNEVENVAIRHDEDGHWYSTGLVEFEE